MLWRWECKCKHRWDGSFLKRRLVGNDYFSFPFHDLGEVNWVIAELQNNSWKSET